MLKQKTNMLRKSSVLTYEAFQKCPISGGHFPNLLKFQTFQHCISLPFSERQFQTFSFPDFSVHKKKIILRNPKMDIFKMSKNVQNRNLMGSLK